MKHTISILLVSALLASCSSTESDPNGTPDSKPTSRSSGEKLRAMKQLDKEAYDHFGDGIAADGDAVALADLAGDPARFKDSEVRLAGTVQSVCKKKGCWMKVADGDNMVFVKFRDYAFFVPKDCEGHEVIVRGTFSCDETSVAELKHYLEDEGKHEEAAKVTEPRIEMKLMADGVALRKKS